MRPRPRRERSPARPPASAALAGAPLPSCAAYVDAYLADYALRNRASSLATTSRRLRRFRTDFAGHSLALGRAELKQWLAGEGRWSAAGPVPRWEVVAIIGLYNHAIDEAELPLRRNPASGLRPRLRVWAEQPPPSAAEFEALCEACTALGPYGKRVRAMLLFATHTLTRPGELYALRWSDLDLRARRIRHCEFRDGDRRLVRRSALTPAARDAIARLPRDSDSVFTSKTGRPLSGPAMLHHWRKVTAAAGLEFRFHHLTKHYGAYYLSSELGLSPRAIAAQGGWALATANRILALYGHGEASVLAQVDAAFARAEAGPSPRR